MTDTAHAHDPLVAIQRMVQAGDTAGAGRACAEHNLHPDDVRSLFGALSIEEAAALFAALTPSRRSRDMLLWLPVELAGAILSEIDPTVAAGLLTEMPSDERADLLGTLTDQRRAAVQSHMPTDARADAARLLAYAKDTAGGLMETEYLAFNAASPVREAIRDIRANQERYAAIGVQYVYLLDQDRRLVGVAPMRDLMLAPEHSTLQSLMRQQPLSVEDTTDLHGLAELFDECGFMALPVVDARGVMLGVVTRADATEGEQQEAEDDYRVSQGIVGGEELRSMPIAMRLRRRSAWLGVNMLLCLGGAAVVALHKDTLAKAIVVAAVLPVVSATSGNAAMQAAAVSIRELTLGVIDPKAWRFVLVSELSLAGLMAVPLGFVVALLAMAWGASWVIGLAVGVAMAVNTLIAIALGAMCPLVLRRLSIDPALASGPITTTIADVTGFAITLSLVLYAIA